MKIVTVLFILPLVIGRDIDWEHLDRKEAKAVVDVAIKHLRDNTTVFDGTFNGPDYGFQVGDYHSKTWAYTIKTQVTGMESATLNETFFRTKSGFMWRYDVAFQVLMPMTLVSGQLVLYNETYERGPPKFEERLDFAVVAIGPESVFNVSITMNHVYKTIEIQDVKMQRDAEYAVKVNCNEKVPEWMCASGRTQLEDELNAKRNFADRNMMNNLYEFFDVPRNFV